MPLRDRNNMVSGELSPRLLGRNELDGFKRGVKTMRDFLPLPYGGAMNRYGFEAVMPTRRNSVGYAYEFSYAETDSVVVAFFPGWIRFFDNEGVILDPDGVYSVTAVSVSGSDTVLTLASVTDISTEDDLFVSGTGDHVLDGQFFQVTAIDVPNKKVTVKDCFGNSVLATAATGLTASAQVVYEIPNPYGSELYYANLSTAQKGEVMSFCNSYHPMYELTRNDRDDWTLARTTLTGTVFYDAVSGITKANPAVVTTSAAHGYSTGDTVFLDSVGGMTEVNGRWFTVTRVDATRFSLDGVNSTGYTTYVSGGVAANSLKQPGVVSYFGGRRFLGGALFKPDWFYGSKLPLDDGTTQYNDFTTGSNAKDGVAFSVSSVSGTKDVIVFFSGTNRFLAIGSTGGTYKVDGGSDGAPIATGAIRSLAIDATPAARVEPVSNGTSTEYVRSDGDSLNSLEYDLFADGYTAVDMTLLTGVTASSGFKRLTKVVAESDLTLALRNDGVIAVLSRKGREEIAGWSTIHAAGTSAKFLSMCGMREADGRDTVWVCTERTVHGQTRRMIERMVRDPRGVERPYTGDRDADRWAYEKLLKEKASRMTRLDSCLMYDGAQQTSLTISGSTATAGTATFAADDVGQRIRVKYLTGYETGVAVITNYISPTEVEVEVHQAFSSAAFAAGEWYLCVNKVYIPHLEGETVAYVGDGGQGTSSVVTNGWLSLDGSYGRVIAGLEYDAFFELTPIIASDQYGNQEPGENVRVLQVALRIFETQAVWAGEDPYSVAACELPRAKQQAFVACVPITDVIKAPGLTGFSNNLCYTIMARNGLPCTVLAVTMTTE